MPANPYTITRANFKTAKFPFDRLLEREEGIANKILGLAAARGKSVPTSAAQLN